MLTPYDKTTFARSLAFAILLCGLVLSVLLATDGATTSVQGKLARLAVLAPVLGAMACGMTRVQAQLRGESVALHAIGTSHARALAGALSVVTLFGALGALALATRVTDLSALFPTLGQVSWSLHDQSNWIAVSAGVVLDARSGAFSFIAPIEDAAHNPPTRLPVVVATAFSTFALTLWLSRPVRLVPRIAVGFAAIAATIVVLHFLAAARWSEWMLLVGPATLVAHAGLDASRTTRKATRRAI